MTKSTFKKRTALFTCMGRLAFLLALTGPTTACDGGREGDRCVPQSVGFSHDDCNSGLTCTTIVDPASGATCGESYCCPSSGPSSNPYCNASLIAPAPDGAPGLCPVPATATTAAPAPSDASGETGGDDGPAASSGDASGEASAADAPSD